MLLTLSIGYEGDDTALRASKIFVPRYIVQGRASRRHVD